MGVILYDSYTTKNSQNMHGVRRACCLAMKMRIKTLVSFLYRTLVSYYSSKLVVESWKQYMKAVNLHCICINLRFIIAKVFNFFYCMYTKLWLNSFSRDPFLLYLCLRLKGRVWIKAGKTHLIVKNAGQLLPPLNHETTCFGSSFFWLYFIALSKAASTRLNSLESLA